MTDILLLRGIGKHIRLCELWRCVCVCDCDGDHNFGSVLKKFCEQQVLGRKMYAKFINGQIHLLKQFQNGGHETSKRGQN